MNKKRRSKKLLKTWSQRMQRWLYKMAAKGEKVQLSNLMPRKPGESAEDQSWTVKGYSK